MKIYIFFNDSSTYFTTTELSWSFFELHIHLYHIFRIYVHVLLYILNYICLHTYYCFLFTKILCGYRHTTLPPPSPQRCHLQPGRLSRSEPVPTAAPVTRQCIWLLYCCYCCDDKLPGRLLAGWLLAAGKSSRAFACFPLISSGVDHLQSALCSKQCCILYGALHKHTNT